MAESKKILSSNFKSEWKGPNGTVNYHEVTFEEGEKPWQIGAKEKNPSFLEAGKTLNFEVKDMAKRSIKRVQADAPVSGGQSSGSGYSQVGVTVGAALNQAVTLVSHGVVEFKDLKKTAHRLVEVAFELKEEFKDRG